jgi:hypothetical protein
VPLNAPCAGCEPQIDGQRRRQARRADSFRLTPDADNDLTRSSRQVAIVAADTEDEARRIASVHDVFQRDWRDPHFAVADAMETPETHVFGDAIFRSEPVVVEERKRVARRG